MAMKDLSVAIAGAGIGGLTAALALARSGRRVTVVERRTGFAELGAGLQLSPNATRLLLDLGLGPALRRIVGEPDRVVVRSLRTGRPIGDIALGAFMRERLGAPYWVVQRADLQTVLLDAVRSDPAIRLVVGRTVEGAVEAADGVSLRLTTARGGEETLTTDLAVGADGVWSRLRAAIGDGRVPAFRGHVAWRATIDRAAAPAELAGNETGLWLGPAGHVVHYPIAGGRFLNIVAIERRDRPVEGWSEPGAREDLLGRFAGAAPLLRTLLGTPASWLLWSLYDLPARTMTRGRIALLGDAAHPVLPFLAQGAALAIEDAAALAGALARADTVPGALRAYEAARLPRVRTVPAHARRNGRHYHAGSLMAFARDRVMRHLGAEGMTERYAWLYGWRGGAD
jgi:salicylate hydroxylase